MENKNSIVLNNVALVLNCLKSFILQNSECNLFYNIQGGRKANIRNNGQRSHFFL